MMKKILCCFLSLTLGSAGFAEDCSPEGVERDITPVEMPSSIPANFPQPAKPIVMSADTGVPDEYNPFGYARADLLVEGDMNAVFTYYEAELPKAGYNIVMWEKDTGAMGFRVRGEGLDQATISINSYDCRVLVGLNFSLLP
jgi:hypothetical protein